MYLVLVCVEESKEKEDPFIYAEQEIRAELSDPHSHLAHTQPRMRENQKDAWAI